MALSAQEALEVVQPLDAGRFASTAMPTSAQLVFTDAFAPEKRWHVQDVGLGQATIDLGRDHRLLIDENNASILVANLATGETTQIFGTGDVMLDGEDVYRFWGTTTFALQNGTKITVVTALSNDNANVIDLQRVVITRAERAIEITGLGSAAPGDLEIAVSRSGWSKDFETPDNFIVRENAAGAGWVRRAGKPVTQEDFNRTMVGERYGPASQRLSMRDLRKLISFHLTGMVGQHLSNLASSLSEDNQRNERAINALRLSENRADWLAFRYRRAAEASHGVEEQPRKAG